MHILTLPHSLPRGWQPSRRRAAGRPRPTGAATRMPAACPPLLQMLREALHDTFPAKQQAHAAQAASYQQQLATIEASLDEQQRLLQEASAAAEGHDRQVHRLREEAKGKREEVRGWQRQLGEHQARVQELEEERAALEEANQEVAEDFMRSTQEAVAGHRQRVAACRDRCERAGVAASGARQYRAEREVALAAAREGVLAAERSLVDGQNRLRRVEGDLQRLQASQGERWRGLRCAAGPGLCVGCAWRWWGGGGGDCGWGLAHDVGRAVQLALQM